MSSGMRVSESQQAGFALAATIARDPGAHRAAPGLAADAREGFCALARDLEHLAKAERRDWVRRVAQPAPIDFTQQGRRAPRALALLAGRDSSRPPRAPQTATKALGPVLAGASLPRPGFVPEPGLYALLSRIARRPAEP
jgi:hypothetical protein